MILSLIVVALSPLFINVFFGSEYSESVSVLRVHMWSMVFSFLGSACTQWLVVEGLTKYRLVRVLIGVFVNISLNIVLIPSYGVLGAAYATLISQMLHHILGIFLVKKRGLFLNCKLSQCCCILSDLALDNVCLIKKRFRNEKYKFS